MRQPANLGQSRLRRGITSILSGRPVSFIQTGQNLWLTTAQSTPASRKVLTRGAPTQLSGNGGVSTFQVAGTTAVVFNEAGALYSVAIGGGTPEQFSGSGGSVVQFRVSGAGRTLPTARAPAPLAKLFAVSR